MYTCVLITLTLSSPFYFYQHVCLLHVAVFFLFLLLFMFMTPGAQLVLPVGMLSDLGLTLCRSCSGDHRCHGHVKSRRQRFTALLPTLWPLHSFPFLFCVFCFLSHGSGIGTDRPLGAATQQSLILSTLISYESLPSVKRSFSD